MENTGTCAHEACNCLVTDDDSYCSQSCKDAADGDLVELMCDCGHASCG